MPLECPPGFALYQDIVQRIGEVRPCGQGIRFKCLFPDRHRNGDRSWSGYACIGHNGNLIARCHGCGAGWPEIKAEVGLPGGAWFPHKGRIYPERTGRAATQSRRQPVSEPVAVYDYRSEDGTLLYQKLRYEPKRFCQRRPLARHHWKHMDIPDTAGEVWVWGLTSGEYGRAYRDGRWDLTAFDPQTHQCSVTLEGQPYCLYRLPELAAANPDHPVFLVEGEKDVETVRGLGFTATCTATAGGVPDPEWFAPLAGRRVVIVADNDWTGTRHAMQQAGILVCGGVRSLRVIWPGYGGYDVGPGEDITDWLSEGRKREDLIALAKMFPEYRSW